MLCFMLLPWPKSKLCYGTFGLLKLKSLIRTAQIIWRCVGLESTNFQSQGKHGKPFILIQDPGNNLITINNHNNNNTNKTPKQVILAIQSSEAHFSPQNAATMTMRIAFPEVSF